MRTNIYHPTETETSRPELQENYISDYTSFVRNCDFLNFFREGDIQNTEFEEFGTYSENMRTKKEDKPQ